MTEIEGDEQTSASGEMDTGRVLALSDGVFAIAATLLVLDLKLPESFDEKELPQKLHELLPAFGGYALGYVLIGLVWISHHRQFRNFTRISTRVARLNLLFLGSVSVLPFVTSLLRYDVPIAAQVYATTVVVIFLLGAAMGWVAQRYGHHADPVAGRMFSWYSLVMALVFVVSIPLASIPGHGPAIAKYSWLAAVPARWILRFLIKRAGLVAGRRQ
jgi:TMEM175 potassium channel family protein